MHSILASLSALFKSGYLFIQSVPAKSLPSLRHVAQIPIAPLGADSQAVIQELFVQTDAQPEAPAVQPAALQVDGPQPPPGGQLAAVQPAVEVPSQGAALNSRSTRIDRFDIFLFDFFVLVLVSHKPCRFLPFCFLVLCLYKSTLL